MAYMVSYAVMNEDDVNPHFPNASYNVTMDERRLLMHGITKQ